MSSENRIERNGFVAELHQEEEDFNPRKEHDNVGTMVCWHSRYNLGDEPYRRQNDESPDEWARSLAAQFKGIDSDDPSLDDMSNVWNIIHEYAIVLPLYLYDHSGITISTSSFSCPWDSGQVGYIYCTLAKAEEEWGGKYADAKEGTTIERARKYLAGEVETYDQYLTSDVWYYTIENEDGDIVDSCGGFFGYEYAKQAMEEALGYQVKHAEEEDAYANRLMAL